jgi:type II secretory pathway pseudopilin PulG
MRRRTGFMLPELIFALALLATAAVIWAEAAARVRRADLGLADSRDATRIAEQALIAMQSGGTESGSKGNAKITMERCKDGTQVAGYAWVYIEATVGDQKQGLVGLVPEAALKRGGQ